MPRGFCVWHTGLPCSGKTTIAKILKEELEKRNLKTYLLDGDIIRRELNQDLGFSKQDRDENIRRVSVVAKILVECEIIPIVAFVSPYIDARKRAREKIKNFVEVFVKAPVEVCAKRDTKGLYEKAFKGEIKNFTGVNDPYEEPLSPEVVCETDKETPQHSVEKILRKLEELGYIEKKGYTDYEEELVRKRLEDLGYL